MPGTTPGKKRPLRGSNSEVYGFPAGGGLAASDVSPFALRAWGFVGLRPSGFGASPFGLGASPFGLRPHKTTPQDDPTTQPDRPGVEMSDPAIRHLKPSVSDNLLNQFADIGFRI
jgi:hypothetical protein